MSEEETTAPLPAPSRQTLPIPEESRLAGVMKAPGIVQARGVFKRIFGPWSRTSARIINYLSANERRQGRTALVLALSINLIVLTLMSTFARVRIWIPNAPSDTIQITLVEPLPMDLPLRDPVIEIEPEPEPEEAEPEPEPEIVEEPEQRPDPVPDPEPEAPAEITPEPEPEPEIIEEPEPEINLDIRPQLAPPADAPEPLIADPEPVVEDDFVVPAPELVEEAQSPIEEDPEPLVSVEPQSAPEAGLDEILGEDEALGDDVASEEDDGVIEDEPQLAEAPEEPIGDDMFDEEPDLGARRFVLPQVALPQVDSSVPALAPGEAILDPGASGVIAIFCPEQFTNEEKQKECAGRPEIRSGWRPGASGEDWSRATELLKNDRNRGITGPTAGPVADTLTRRRDLQRMEDLRDFRRSADDINNLPDAGDDNLMRGIEGNRPNIGPAPFEPNWTLREDNGLTQKEIDELKKQLEEAADDD